MNCEQRSAGGEREPNPINYLYQYAVTIKPTFKSNIDKVLKNRYLLLDFYYTMVVKFRLISMEYNIEFDSKHVPHIHATVLSNDPKLNMLEKGWHIYIKYIYEITGWRDYIQKDSATPMLQHFRDTYSFIPDSITS